MEITVNFLTLNSLGLMIAVHTQKNQGSHFRLSPSHSPKLRNSTVFFNFSVSQVLQVSSVSDALTITSNHWWENHSYNGLTLQSAIVSTQIAFLMLS